MDVDDDYSSEEINGREEFDIIEYSSGCACYIDTNIALPVYRSKSLIIITLPSAITPTQPSLVQPWSPIQFFVKHCLVFA